MHDGVHTWPTRKPFLLPARKESRKDAAWIGFLKVLGCWGILVQSFHVPSASTVISMSVRLQLQLALLCACSVLATPFPIPQSVLQLCARSAVTLQPWVTGARRYLHRIPELARHEYKTSAYIQASSSSCGNLPAALAHTCRQPC